MTERGPVTPRRFNMTTVDAGSAAGRADEVAPVVEELVEERAGVVEQPGQLAVVEAGHPDDGTASD